MTEAPSNINNAGGALLVMFRNVSRLPGARKTGVLTAALDSRMPASSPLVLEGIVIVASPAGSSNLREELLIVGIAADEVGLSGIDDQQG
jgi:hypothetical protein